ncbi:hypothetical protein [Desulfobacula sp.]|uniref:hypothetical protein n=1 Tax=Desulfobacula sp. TaxID=2593537 RepID=UPI002714DCB9|nr:hypothetical protein [Desulfobacula sp.]
MKNVITLSMIFLLIGLSSAVADDKNNWEATLNDYISAINNLACVEKRSPELKECSIPVDKCKRFVTIVSKNCLGQAILSRKSIKHPKDMSEKELLSLIDKATICSSKIIPVMTYYVCPEQHERNWAGRGGFKWKGKNNNRK